MVEVNKAQAAWANYIDAGRLGLVQEELIEPDLEVVDPHFHLMSAPFRYDPSEWIADLRSGHKVVGTVHTQGGTGHYRADGPPHLKSLGETEYLMNVIDTSDRDATPVPVCSGIIAGCDLMQGAAKVNEVLDGQAALARGLLRGIRVNLFWKYDANGAMFAAPGLEDVAARGDLAEGISCLAARHLSLDLIAYHANLSQVAQLAEKFPDTTFIVNHLGTIVDSGDQPKALSEMMAVWRDGIDAIAAQGNVRMKMGGCANPIVGRSMPDMQAYLKRTRPPTSEELAASYRPFVDFVIEKFGPKRCMFESNFPVDKRIASYRIVWNAFKRLAQPYPAEDRRQLLATTAMATYRIAV